MMPLRFFVHILGIGLLWFVPSAHAGLTGVITVVGTGPEQKTIERLAREFEKENPGIAVDIKWNRNFKVADMVKAGKADLAVTGMDDPELTATTIAWDGIAVIVNFSNRVKEVTTQQLRDLFSGKIRLWSDLDEHATERVELIRRPDDQNITAGFEHSLGITGKMNDTVERIRSDQRVLSRVSGRLGAVGYLSLEVALEAVKFGTPVRILLVDGVEPGQPTVRNRQYKLRRPVLFLTRKQSSPLLDAFITFTRSPQGQRIVDEVFTPATD